jgi:hypothetical protein
MKKYNQETEGLMILFYSRLKEKEKRHYASLEAKKLGYGGKLYIGTLLGISQKTIRKGDKELENPQLYHQIGIGKQRRSGGGRHFFLLACLMFCLC